MFFIPGQLIALLSFPGVIMHEIAHRYFADRAGVPVYQVCYFRFGNPAGYVIHGPVQGLKNSFLISVGPLIVNTLLCALLTFSAVFPFFVFDAKDYNPIFAVLMWVGISIGAHAFPSNEDMKNFSREVLEAKGKSGLYYLARAFEVLLLIANTLRFFWFDFIYAVGVSLAIPFLVFGL